MKKNIGFYPGELMLPKEHLRERFSVVACDQFTSQPEYWNEVDTLTEGHPSANHMIFPEVWLDKVDFDAKVAAIQETTRFYLEQQIFDCFPESYIYVERTQRNGAVRRGLVGVVDLECYDYKKGSRSLIRATEGTVLERIPPRVKIREGAYLEAPHVMLLIDDPDRTVIEPFMEKKAELPMVYDFDLMMDGGHLAGWQVGHGFYEKVTAALAKLGDSKTFNQKIGTSRKSPILFAVGDGNHSLASAKACWENIKSALTEEEQAHHPARWAAVEVCNLHDEALVFEPIHRAVFDVDQKAFVKALTEWAGAQPKGRKNLSGKQWLTVLSGSKEKTLVVAEPDHTLTVGSVQEFLDKYLAENGGRVDYIHGEDAVRKLTEEGAVGILLPAMDKADLFRTVVLEGALPRKTFSMGEAWDKRYYLECRKIK